MKKKGFTLVELLGVITILALLALIAIPAITKSIKDNKQKLYNDQIELILTAARVWGSDNKLALSKLVDNETATITLGSLKSSSYLEKKIINPLTNQQFSDCMEINIRKEDNNFAYSIGEIVYGTCNFGEEGETIISATIQNDNVWTATLKAVTINISDTDLIKSYSLTNTDSSPSSWVSVGLKQTVSISKNMDIGNYYVWVKDVKDELTGPYLINVKKIDKTGPELILGTTTSTTSTIVVPITTNTDNESAIQSTICEYGTTTNYGMNGTFSGNSCIFTGLSSGVTYYYRVRTINGANIENVQTGSKNTQSFGTVSLSANPDAEIWSTSKIITISGTNSDIQLQYKIGQTDTWHDIANNGEITLSENNTVYGRYFDGIAGTSPATLVVTKIDTTDPELTLGTASSTTSTITIPITTNKDDQSGIKSTTCVYGLTTSYGSNGTISNNNCTITGLTTGTTYYYKVITKNGANIEAIAIGSKTTSSPTYLAYSIGNAIYYNPISNSMCTQSAYNNNADKLGKTGCLKFYAIANSSASSSTVKAILDHNTSDNILFNSGNAGTMSEARTALITDTSGWSGNPTLITANEIATAIGQPSILPPYFFETGTNTRPDSFTGEYAWLYDYTYNCTVNGCNYNSTNSSNRGYWTATSYMSNNIYFVYTVEYTGRIYHGTYPNSTYYGIRPVITITKSTS